MAALSPLPDHELVFLLKTGDKDAYTEIYNRYKGILYQHAYKLLRNQEEVDDIIHELFTTLWIKRETLEFKTNLSGYLYTAVRNRVLDYISHQQIESAYIISLQKFIDKGVAITDHRVRLNMLQEVIEKEIACLPAKMREIFELSRKSQLSHREIAEKLDISEKTVKNQVNNALKILRVRLGLLIYLYLLYKIR
ncbi:MAG: polymerase subunit sigma-70 [Mucilaginibacter sp.]|jgi:RNA polymerase sigma-70 factor (family 1)|nr:polymerase subunit sigma-70 [Mucilaginibacter sp.]